MHKLSLFLMLLAMHVVAKGQTYEYRYWFDNETSQTVTGTSESSSWQIVADVSALSDLPHVFHFQSKDSTGVWSSVVSRFFVKQTPATGITGQYWFDNDVANKHNVGNSGLTADIDVSGLRNGLHLLHYQAISCGSVSPVVSLMFVRTQTGVELDNVQLCYLFDDQTEFALQHGTRSGNTYHYTIDVSGQPDGEHTLTWWLVGTDGLGTDVHTDTFLVHNRRLVYPVDGIAIVENPDGELDDILQEKELVRVLILTDTVRGGDFAALHNVPNMEELTLPLVNSRKDSIRLGTFDRLLAVTTTDSASVLQDYVFEGATPNLMIYAPTGATVESPGRNIILGGVSESILLTDGYPMLIPEAFTAKTISYTRNFSKQTVIGQSSGWETLALPYQVQTIATQDGRTLVPFGAEQTGDGNFWLAAMDSDGFQAATAIAANTPYILAMPNNEEYTLGNVTGPVTFSATDAEVRSTTGLSPVEGAYIFTPTYRGQGGSSIYAINDEAYQDYLPGGVFVRGLRDVQPFEAYLTLPAGAKQRNVIPVFESETTGMDDVRWSMYDERWTMYDVPGGEKYYDLSGRRIGKPTKTGTYLLKNGKRVQKVWVK